MTGKGSGLAARLLAAVKHQESARQTEVSTAEAARTVAREERNALFDSLIDFGTQLPFLGVERTESGVHITNGDRHLDFVEEGDADVSLRFSGRDDREVHRVYRELVLDGRWVWQRVRGGREDRLPLFDQGLEVLMVHALGLPDPDAPAASTPVQPDEGSASVVRKRDL